MKLTSGNISSLSDQITWRILQDYKVLSVGPKHTMEVPPYILHGKVKKAIKECFGIDARESL